MCSLVAAGSLGAGSRLQLEAARMLLAPADTLASEPRVLAGALTGTLTGAPFSAAAGFTGLSSFTCRLRLRTGDIGFRSIVSLFMLIMKTVSLTRRYSLEAAQVGEQRQQQQRQQRQRAREGSEQRRGVRARRVRAQRRRHADYHWH